MNTYKINFYISTGDKRMLYTLRHMIKRFNSIGECTGWNSIYHCILSNDKDKAVIKANEYIEKYFNAHPEEASCIEKPDFDLNDIKRDGSSKINHWLEIVIEEKIFPFGKYKGEKIEDILESDAQYCIWFAENCCKEEQWKEIKEYILGSQKETVQAVFNEREARERVNAEKIATNKKLFAKYVAVLNDNNYGFCDSIANELKEGHLPRGRGFSIMVSILAKRISNSRKNSKKYNEAYNKIFEELVECIED